MKRKIPCDNQRIILVIEDTKASRDDIRSTVEREHRGITVNAFRAIQSALKAVQRGRIDAERVAVVALDLNLGDDFGPETTIGSITHLRKLFPKARILAYSTIGVDPEMETRAKKGGAHRVCLVDHLDAVITEILLESELLYLAETSPLVSRVLQTINIGISVQTHDMKLVWANQTTLTATGIGSVRDLQGRECWRCYHLFENRRMACASCTGAHLLQSADRLIERHRPEGVGNWRERHDLRDSHSVMLLPLRQPDGSMRVGRVEVSSSVFLNDDGTSVLALIEAARFTTEEWEKNTDALTRLNEVMDAAREMTKYRPDVTGCPAIALYYRTDPMTNWHRFDFVTGPGVKTEPEPVVNPAGRHAFAQVAEHRRSGVIEPAVQDECPHYLWMPPKQPGESDILVDVRLPKRLADETVIRVLDADLAPYWRYMAEQFAAAKQARDTKREVAANAKVREYMAAVSEQSSQIGSHDEVVRKRNELVRSTVRYLKEAFSPVGCHIRVLDRQRNSLAKLDGFGSWYDMADADRYLDEPFHGSSQVARTREPRISFQPDIEEMTRSVTRKLSLEEKDTLREIAAYITMPLLFSGRFLGTLTLQFNDDCLITKGIKEAVTAIGNVLAGALAALESAHERHKMAGFFRKLDASIFRELGARGSEDELAILKEATDTLFELTHSEFVSYYGYDASTRAYKLKASSTHTRPSGGYRLPDQLPKEAQFTKIATQSGAALLVEDCDDPKWELLRQSLTDLIPNNTHRNSRASIACLIIAPVLIGAQVEGALVVQSCIANWMNNEDKAITGEFAFKIAHCLQAIRTKAQLDRELMSRSSLTAFQSGLVRAFDSKSLDRLFLLTVTAGEFIGFSRAILFLSSDNGATFTVRHAVGETDRVAQESAWQNAGTLTYTQKVERILASEPTESLDGMYTASRGIVLRRTEETPFFRKLEEHPVVVRRLNRDHLFQNPKLRCLLIPLGANDVEYAAVRLTAPPNVSGILVTDRSFLPRASINDQELELLRLWSSEFTMMLKALTRTTEARLEAWRKLSNRSAHKIGNILTAADGALRRASRTDRASHETALADLKADLRAIRGVIDAYRNFARNEPCSLQLSNIRPLLESLVRQFAEVRENADVRLDMSAEDLNWPVDSAHLAQAIGELLENALHFGNQVTVSVHSTAAMMQIVVSDNGPGVPNELKESIFEPFYSTRPKGSGLGLAIVRQIIENHNGTIKECGELGRGACFIIEIPNMQQGKEIV